MTYYAYVHARPDTEDSSGVFYVGKGVRSRYRPLPIRNKFHGHVVKKYGADNILVGRLDCSDEATAFSLEQGLIKCLRRAGVKLTNMTDGGEGSSGAVVTAETRAKISAANKIAQNQPHLSEKRSRYARKANAERWADPEYKARAAQSMRGVKKTTTDASTQARRENAKKAQTPEAKALRAAASKARWADPEFRAKMAEKKRAAWADPEKRAAMLKGRSEGISKSWQDEATRNKRIRGIKKATNTSEEGN